MKIQKDMGKQGKFSRNSGRTWENIWVKPQKRCKNMGKHRMKKFISGKTRENTGITWENMQIHGRALDDKVLFWENMGKHWKTCQNIGKQ